MLIHCHKLAGVITIISVKYCICELYPLTFLAQQKQAAGASEMITGLAASHWLQITRRESWVRVHVWAYTYVLIVCVCVCVATKQWSPAGWKDMEEVEEWGVWQSSVRRGNGMVLLKLVIRLLWHPACMEDVRRSPPGGEEVHRSGSVIFSVSATLFGSLSAWTRTFYLHYALVFSFQMFKYLQENAQTCWALGCWRCLCDVCSKGTQLWFCHLTR